MRIVSLHPACTEWVVTFGASGDLVGRSYACEYPELALRVPAVTLPASKAAEPEKRRLIDQADGASFVLDEKLLVDLKPDVLLAGEGVSARDLERLRWESDRKPAILQMNPVTFKEVLDGGLRVGKTIGRLREAMRYIGETEKNLLKLQRRLSSNRNARVRPTAVCIEGFDPLRFSGRWVPDLVELAGGRMLTPQGRAGDGSYNEVLRLAPDVLAVVPPTGGIDAARRAADRLASVPAWHSLPAALSGQIYAFDGALFGLPGPRLYRAIELLSAALHPGQGVIAPQPMEMARVRTS